MRREFVLRPFPGREIPDVSFSGFLVRHRDRLRIVYHLTGALQSLSIPEPSSKPERKSGLWEETCFELFMAPSALERYWEFNLSPAGHWNVFCFDAYRSGMREEAAWQSLPFTVERAENGLSLSLECDLSRIAERGQRFDVGVSAVLCPSPGQRGVRLHSPLNGRQGGVETGAAKPFLDGATPPCPSQEGSSDGDSCRAVPGGPSYWALCHRGLVADFHRRDGFSLSL